MVVESIDTYTVLEGNDFSDNYGYLFNLAFNNAIWKFIILASEILAINT